MAQRWGRAMETWWWACAMGGRTSGSSPVRSDGYDEVVRVDHVARFEVQPVRLVAVGPDAGVEVDLLAAEALCLGVDPRQQLPIPTRPAVMSSGGGFVM